MRCGLSPLPMTSAAQNLGLGSVWALIEARTISHLTHPSHSTNTSHTNTGRTNSVRIVHVYIPIFLARDNIQLKVTHDHSVRSTVTLTALMASDETNAKPQLTSGSNHCDGRLPPQNAVETVM
jgi:hypothetical protein